MPAPAEQNIHSDSILPTPEVLHSPEKEFSGKVILITGSARPNGIGAATAREFAQQGALGIIISGREQSYEKATMLLDELAEMGTHPFWVPGDVSDPETSYQLIRGTMERFGRLDVLVNCAGITRDNPINRMSIEDWNDVLETNTRPSFLLLREAIEQKAFKKGSTGAVIHVASIVGIYGNRGQENYSASKAAIIGLTKTQSQEFGPRGIRVNAVAPGLIVSDMTHGMTEQATHAMVAATPLGRLGVPEDVASVIAFLASDKAAFISGQTIEVDGGLNGGIIGVQGMLRAGYSRKE